MLPVINQSTLQSPFRLPLDYYPRPRLSWFALQTGLQSVRDVIKSVRGRGLDLWQDGVAAGETKGTGNVERGTHLLEVMTTLCTFVTAEACDL
jgi:hypothetical protein